MKGIEKGRKKETPNLFGWGIKKSSVKEKTYTLKLLIISSNLVTSHLSCTPEVFRPLLFITFHFYTYKGSKCFETAYFCLIYGILRQ